MRAGIDYSWCHDSSPRRRKPACVDFVEPTHTPHARASVEERTRPLPGKKSRVCVSIHKVGEVPTGLCDQELSRARRVTRDAKMEMETVEYVWAK